MEEVQEQQPQEQEMQLDPYKVIASLQRQIATAAGVQASLEATVETLRDQLREAQVAIQDLSGKISERTTVVEHNGRTSKAKKGK